MLGAFGLARAFGRPLVEFVVAKKHWHRLEDWTEAQGWRLVFVSRFIPAIAFNRVNYAAGLARISWWTFAWSTGVGIPPMTIMMANIGGSSKFIAWEIWALAEASIAFFWSGSWRKYFEKSSLRKHRRLRVTPQPQEIVKSASLDPIVTTGTIMERSEPEKRNMGEILSAGIVGVALVAPLCAVFIVDPAFLASMFAGISSWFAGSNPTLTTGLAIMAAIVVHGLLRRKKLRIDRSSERTAVS